MHKCSSSFRPREGDGLGEGGLNYIVTEKKEFQPPPPQKKHTHTHFESLVSPHPPHTSIVAPRSLSFAHPRELFPLIIEFLSATHNLEECYGVSFSVCRKNLFGGKLMLVEVFSSN